MFLKLDSSGFGLLPFNSCLAPEAWSSGCPLSRQLADSQTPLWRKLLVSLRRETQLFTHGSTAVRQCGCRLHQVALLPQGSPSGLPIWTAPACLLLFSLLCNFIACSRTCNTHNATETLFGGVQVYLIIISGTLNQDVPLFPGKPLVKATRFRQRPRPRSLWWRCWWSTHNVRPDHCGYGPVCTRQSRDDSSFPSWNPQRLSPNFEVHTQSQSQLNCQDYHWVQWDLISLGESCLCHLARVAQQGFSKSMAWVQGIHVPNHHEAGWTTCHLAAGHSSDISQLD